MDARPVGSLAGSGRNSNSHSRTTFLPERCIGDVGSAADPASV